MNGLTLPQFLVGLGLAVLAGIYLINRSRER